MVACLAEVRYAIISGDALAVGLSFIHSSLQTGQYASQVGGACPEFSLVWRETPRTNCLGVGVLKSLERLSFGPVVLIHIEKGQPQSKKPNCGRHSTRAKAASHNATMNWKSQPMSHSYLRRKRTIGLKLELPRDLRCPLFGSIRTSKRWTFTQLLDPSRTFTNC
jgi:hypothetical protein